MGRAAVSYFDIGVVLLRREKGGVRESEGGGWQWERGVGESEGGGESGGERGWGEGGGNGSGREWGCD